MYAGTFTEAGQALLRHAQQVALSEAEALQTLGLAPDAYRALDRAMVVRKARYEYLLAAVAGDELEVGTWLTGSDGRLQMTRHFQVRRGADGATLFRGDWELVCIRISNGRPVRMPQVFMDSYLPAVIDTSGNAAPG